MHRPATVARPIGVAVFLVLAGTATAPRACDSAAWAAHEEYERGRELFSGRIDLKGRIATHLVDMPPGVVRCANCHAAANGPAVPRSLAPRLTRELLLVSRPRRGGPASAYDPGNFCTLLQKGVDPASIVVNVQMPRYQLDAAACHALWRYLTWNPNESSAH